MVSKKSPPIILVFAVIIMLAVISLKSFLDYDDNQKMIAAFTSVGLENTTHSNFTNRVIKNTDFEKTAKIMTFVGDYRILAGFDGFLLRDNYNYYIFIDRQFYFALKPSEREALIAHELGHRIYQPNKAERIQLIITGRLQWFSSYLKTRHDQISTRYQIKADSFSAEKTSAANMASLLNKLYSGREDRENFDYKMRIRNLNKLKQGQ